MRTPSILLLALLLLISAAAVCAEEAPKAKARPPVIAGLKLTVVLRKNELGDPLYFARFKNEGEIPRFVVRPMDGSQTKLVMPFYLLSAVNADGKELEYVGWDCYPGPRKPSDGMFADTTWPKDYVFKIRPGEVRDFSILAEFNFEPGQEYQLKLNYAFWPSDEFWQQMKMPELINLDIVRGTPIKFTAPEIEYLTYYRPGFVDQRGRGIIGDDQKSEVAVQPPMKKATIEWIGASGENRWINCQINSQGHVRDVMIAGDTLTSRELTFLQDFPKLKALWVHQSKIDNAQLGQLLPLEQLVSLRFSDSNLNDTGLLHLQKITNLRRLLLQGTEVTDAAIVAFRKARPNVILFVELK